jgi:hypothetical protein
MEKNELNKLTDEELLVEKKKMMKSKLLHAIWIGFLAGILIFGFVAWFLNPEKKLGFLIPMFFPAYFIYKLLKTPNKNKDLEEVLKERKLS